MGDPDGHRRSLPEMIGRYQMILPIASGGMATVFLALQQGVGGFGREVALKLMHAHLQEDENWVIEFIEEAKLAGRIRHPNVVQVIDVGEDRSGVYLVMDYIEGDALSSLLRASRAAKTKVPTPIALRILHDSLSGLHAAHELRGADGAHLGVVHRDFSPHNVLVGIDGVARLTDFGIAKSASRLTFTRTGTVKGKVSYMSPEQAKGLSVDRRCDVWAAGVVAWEVFANRKLYGAGDDLAIGLRIISERPPRLRDVVPAVSETIDAAVASALTDLDERCPTAAELARRLVEGAEMADTATVSEWVGEIARPKLLERRARADEVALLRSRMGASIRDKIDVRVDVEPPPHPTATAAAAALVTSDRESRGRPYWPIALGAGGIVVAVAATVALQARTVGKTPPPPGAASSTSSLQTSMLTPSAFASSSAFPSSASSPTSPTATVDASASTVQRVAAGERSGRLPFVPKVTPSKASVPAASAAATPVSSAAAMPSRPSLLGNPYGAPK